MMKRLFILLTALGLLIPAEFHALNYYFRQSSPVIAPVTSQPLGTLILDAGHGGEDGGAVSLSGTPESHINLAIVQKMEDILALYGTSPILLRREDISLHDDSCGTLREKKVSDLKNRVASINGTQQATLFSIHQNSFPAGKYHGAQVFYAPTDDSQALAAHIQTALSRSLQPDNTRECKKIPDTVYLMNHINCRGVLVECGFLTNPEEEQLLQTPVYQRKLAAVLSSAWLTSATVA